MIPPRTFCDRGSGSSADLCHKCSFVDLPSVRGGHTGLILEIPYRTLESGGLLSVEKDKKFFGYPPLEEK